MMRLFLMGSLLGLTSLMAADLSHLSNQELLDEVSRRMSGEQSNGTASLIYTCNNYGDLIVTVIGGANTEEKVLVGDLGVARCEAQMTALRVSKSKVKGGTIIAGCNKYADLVKMPVFGSGKFGVVTANGNSTYDNCINQAKTINGGS